MTCLSEKWRDVVGYEGIYEVSNLGRVRTHIHKVTFTKRHGVRKWKQRILKDKTPNGSYARVTLWKNNSPRDFLVHRLVAEAFIPRVEGKEFVNHLDGNPKNNVVTNLEWCSSEENNNHAFDAGLISSAKKTVLIDMDSGKQHEFRSLSKASEFLGRNKGYLSNQLKRGRTTFDNYLVITDS